MLELKKEIQEAGQDVIIFVSKQRGRKLRFPIDTDPSEYEKFQKLGFRIFRCSECKLESCGGDCESIAVEDVVETKEEFTFEDSTEEKSAYKEQTPTDINSKTEQAEIEDTPTEEEGEDINYEDLSLKDLRELFPNIKDTSKAGFIDKIHSEDN